jgi:molybdopterin-guanine dinucleotide biosynthesis protein A
MPSAAILTGGQARRFGGRDKGALLVGGVPILARQLRELSLVSDDILIVGGEPPPVGSVAPGATWRHVPDRVPHQGPLGGLETALHAARDDRTFVIACDMPFVTASLLGYLLSLAIDVEAVVPRTGRGVHPLCSVYDRDALRVVRRQLRAGRLSMRALVDQLRARIVSTHEIEPFGRPEELLANVNSRAELDEVAELAGHEP